MRALIQGIVLAGGLGLVGACGGDPAAEGGDAGRVRAAAPRAREMDPQVEQLRAALDLGHADEARPLLREWRARLGLEGELLAARAAALEGREVEASRCVEAARELDEADPRVYATAAELHAAAGRFETAADEIQRGYAACGSAPELLRAQGVVFLCQPRGARRGLELIESALARDPRLPFVDRPLAQAHLLLGREELAADRPAAALERARRSLSHDPGDVEARRFLADALVAVQEVGAAVAVLEELVAEGQPLEGELALQCKRAAMLELLQRRRDEALGYFARARELGLDEEELGTGARMLREAAEEEVEAGVERFYAEELAAARARFERALELDPDSLAARNHLGVVCFKLEDYEVAARLWRGVLELAAAEELELPQPVHLNLAKALQELGRGDEARAVVQAYLERQPEGPWAEDSRAALLRLE